MQNISKEIISYNESLLPEMVQHKYRFMTENIYRFYRGTNHVFYNDLRRSKDIPASPVTWICGDLHMENFGSFKSDNRLVYFDLNDFDEAILAPCIYEVARLVTSIFIAFESLKIEQKKALNMAQLFLKTYSETLAKGKADYIEAKTARGIVCQFLTAVGKRKPKDLLKNRTLFKNGHTRLWLKHPKHFALEDKLKEQLLTHVTQWLKNDGNSPYNYSVKDAVFRLAGTGSVGQRRYLFLLKSNNDTGEKYILLDMKEAVPSSVSVSNKITQPSWQTEAERVISIQRRMQNRPPALLSATKFKNTSYVMQEMQPTEDSINFGLLKKDYRNMYLVIDQMAMLTASSQIRSSGRQGSAITDELIEFGKSNKWQEQIMNYCIHYASKVKSDYMLFLQDHKKGIFTKGG